MMSPWSPVVTTAHNNQRTPQDINNNPPTPHHQPNEPRQGQHGVTTCHLMVTTWYFITVWLFLATQVSKQPPLLIKQHPHPETNTSNEECPHQPPMNNLPPPPSVTMATHHQHP